ncbi:enoyl-CoA hydratase [Paenibacillus cellulosilyticus]|uniref:Enoyl-CoA hydratase n=1 Tax=Paenibacillus cellulosilyticus TaxID=375489 RepID=A0A2V2YQ75_9BACL|nr:enoyl-CoA hydratase [Paenibacillus cellulosilyticus]PWV98554.1 enoyl-CoA hydratase [Paenibacillus cellulosilyticus]QKS44160.1 enoyl-CoA hydratase [Paenibacillus cellulosilyticus]
MSTLEDNAYSYLKITQVNRVATVTLNRPPVNALSTEVIEELAACLDKLAADQDIKAIILTGEGKCFAAGADIKQFTSAFGDARAGAQLALSMQAKFRRIETMTKPVICAINGASLGGGLELALSCHLRIAADEAQLGLPELNLGLIPGYGGTQRLTRLIGRAKATEMILFSQPINGQEAERLGLVNKSVPREQLHQAAIEWAERIANDKSAASVAAALTAIAEGLDLTLDEGLNREAELFGALFETDSMREGVTAFIEKRPAQFRD